MKKIQLSELGVSSGFTIGVVIIQIIFNVTQFRIQPVIGIFNNDVI